MHLKVGVAKKTTKKHKEEEGAQTVVIWSPATRGSTEQQLEEMMYHLGFYSSHFENSQKD